MSRARILVAGLSDLLASIVVRHVQERDELDLVRVVSPGPATHAAGPTGLEAVESLSRAVSELRPQVLVVGGPLADVPAVLALVERSPHLTILAIQDDGEVASLWELWPRRTGLGELSPDELAVAVATRATTWGDRFR